MPTADRRRFVPAAIQLFLAQDYADKELLVIDDGADSVADLIPAHPQIRYERRDCRQKLGTKRNAGCEAARGEIIMHWDDDDWYASSRIRYQVDALLAGDFDICGIDRVFFVNPTSREAWEYVYPRGGAPWVCGATLCYRKSFWRTNRFPELNVGEDTRFVFASRAARIGILDDNRFFVARVHGGNSSSKSTHDPRWQKRSFDAVRSVVGADWGRCFDPGARKALVSAGSGIGDIIRVTPLIRAAHRLGYDVDVLLAPDEPATADLLRGAPEIARIFTYPDIARNRGARPIPELAGTEYDVATFTTWSVPLSKWVAARARHAFEPNAWLRAGDSTSVEVLARALGWEGPLPAPFAMTSARHFDLAPGTIALHPGCKPGWPWKKWHGFDELAALFPRVAIVGTEADLDNSRTYFERRFAWPDHALDFTGKLDLRDTAALISQCAALVSLDSGLMHVGVALGVPTYGIFGITSPERECMPSPFMLPITKGLACEPACRRQAWGRRDCEFRLECLKMLTAQEVASRVASSSYGRSARLAPDSNGRPAHAANLPLVRKSTISLNYYGPVFDASGYGQAARLYVRALDAAGVRVNVTDTGAKPAHLRDEAVAALAGRDPLADFNLVHGIPPMWARSAFAMRNVIAMTVWETDRMPQMWRNPLSHAIDVWLPCAFNVEVFARDLGRTPFCLPHAQPDGIGAGAPFDGDLGERLGLGASDYVFYSIFEWQERKHPRGLLEAFLRAFPEPSEAILLIKSNAGAAGEAARLLNEVRTETGSHGRVVLHCATFDAGLLRALHERGDCYVSLHKGEGWGYPLFEAAGLGKAVVATAYGGPLDYLDADRHWLVRCELSTVRQRYAYYHPSMHWAEADLTHAAEGMRWTLEHRTEARAAAGEAAARLAKRYSIEAVGTAAKARLIELLERTDPARYTALAAADEPTREPHVLPIPGEWYDAGYFEHGLKSNWQGGYTWPQYAGIFQETATFLQCAFPDATDYLDAGCAKGFLVRSLRDRGLNARGFDHSPWALSHAEPALAPFLELTSVDRADFAEGSIDVLVAMSLFETLTEEQIASFLPRARRWVRGALFATIPSAKGAGDKDLSQITLRSREWWHERFLEAGWRQDPLHRAFERSCERYGFPAQMRWNVYAYVP